MRSHEERVAETKRRIAKIEREKRRRMKLTGAHRQTLRCGMRMTVMQTFLPRRLCVITLRPGKK